MLKARFRAPRPPDIPARMLVLNFVDEEKPSQLMLHDPDSNGAAATPKALAYDPTPADMIADVDVTSSRAEVGAEPTEKNSWVMSRLDRLDARLQSIECRLGRIETRLDGIERSANRSDAVAADVQAIGSHVDSLQSQVNRVEGIKPKLSITTIKVVGTLESLIIPPLPSASLCVPHVETETTNTALLVPPIKASHHVTN
jgi:hypothetical protein